MWVWKKKDGSVLTALDRAAARGHEAVVRLLLEKGANVAAKDHRKRTALQWAATWSTNKAVVQLPTPLASGP
jgi:Ankyrin repeats (many copies)